MTISPGTLLLVAIAAFISLVILIVVVFNDRRW